MTGQISDGEIAFQVQAHDRSHLAPKVRRFLNAYVEAEAARKADFRKGVAQAMQQFICSPSTTPTLKQDLAAAAAISRRAAYMAMANSVCEEGDETKWSFNFSLMRDAYATIAVVYRYVIGLYATDLTLSRLAETALEFMLSAEREFLIADQYVSANPMMPSVALPSTCQYESARLTG